MSDQNLIDTLSLEDKVALAGMAVAELLRHPDWRNCNPHTYFFKYKDGFIEVVEDLNDATMEQML